MSDWFSLARQYLFWLMRFFVVKLHVLYHPISILSVNCFWYTSFYHNVCLQGEKWMISRPGWNLNLQKSFEHPSFSSVHPPPFVCFSKYFGFNLRYECKCIPLTHFNTLILFRRFTFQKPFLHILPVPVDLQVCLYC